VSLYVIDSNVAVKWTAMEPLWQQARRLLEDDDTELIAPTSFLPETVNALVKKFRSHELAADTVRRAQSELGQYVSLYPVSVLIDAALEIALQYAITIHDALFLALAIREQCQLVTDDRRLLNAAMGHFPNTLLPLNSMPDLSGSR
jgi:predicted nucleic acid-binding protein